MAVVSGGYTPIRSLNSQTLSNVANESISAIASRNPQRVSVLITNNTKGETLLLNHVSNGFGLTFFSVALRYGESFIDSVWLKEIYARSESGNNCQYTVIEFLP